MKGSTGLSNAAAYHDQVTKLVLSKMRLCLKEVRKSGEVFDTLTRLSKHVGKSIGVSDVSLRRNQNYRIVLERHFAGQSAGSVAVRGGARLMPDDHSDYLRARLNEENLRAEVRYLRALIDRYRENMSGGGSPVLSAAGLTAADAESMASGMAKIIERANYRIDVESGRILDDYPDTRRGETAEVVGSAEASAFLKWLRLTRDLELPGGNIPLPPPETV